MAEQMRVYIGTYTKNESQGIYVAEFDAAKGELAEPRLAGEAVNPSFAALHPDGRTVYAVSEGGADGSSVAAFHVEPRGGGLSLVNRVASGGKGPCFVGIDPTGRAVLAANYGSGSVASFPVREDGSLGEAATVIQHEGSGPDPKRQKGPHAHSIKPDPTGRFALACDLGLDKVLVYALDAERATLTPTGSVGMVPPGSGPRMPAFHPNGRFLYVVNEMGGSVTVFAWDGDTNPGAGKLDAVQTIPTLPEGYEGQPACAEVAVHSSGKFVYASNRGGHDSLAMYRVDEATGKLTWLGYVGSGGKEPRHFEIDPTGRWLLAAHQGSDNIVVFAIDGETGSLTHTGREVKVSMPVCVRFG